jgi:hypothetical protein
MKAVAPKEKLATRAGLAQFLRFGLVGVATDTPSCGLAKPDDAGHSDRHV